MDYFRNKSVMVTGGSSGIGLATARLLRRAGANLTLVARDEAKLNSAKAAVPKKRLFMSNTRRLLL